MGWKNISEGYNDTSTYGSFLQINHAQMYFLYNFSSILDRPKQERTVPSAHQKIDKVSLIDFIYKPGMDYIVLFFSFIIL